MIALDGIQVRLAGITHNIQPHELERYLQIGWERVVVDEAKPETLTSQAKPKKKIKDSGAIHARAPKEQV